VDTHDIIIYCTPHQESITHFCDVYHHDKANIRVHTDHVTCHLSLEKKDITRNRKNVRQSSANIPMVIMIIGTYYFFSRFGY